MPDLPKGTPVLCVRGNVVGQLLANMSCNHGLFSFHFLYDEHYWCIRCKPWYSVVRGRSWGSMSGFDHIFSKCLLHLKKNMIKFIAAPAK